jgi:hypothetical protein
MTWIIRTGSSELDRQNWIVRTGSSELDRQNWIVRTASSELDRQNWIIRTGSSELDHQNWIIRTGCAPFTFSLNGYRMAIGYFRVAKVGEGGTRGFLVDFGVTVRHSVFGSGLR